MAPGRPNTPPPYSRLTSTSSSLVPLHPSDPARLSPFALNQLQRSRRALQRMPTVPSLLCQCSARTSPVRSSPRDQHTHPSSAEDADAPAVSTSAG
eukprot:1617399-Pleurochrysis_carterae.AAC.1